MRWSIVVLLAVFSTTVAAQDRGSSPYREVDVCFVLDTTGSMGGLIQAAKDKIWFIANEIANAPSRPRVRFCLVAFRDRGDAYVTRHTDLTTDMDAVYRELLAFQPDGGGDTPEAVNQALREAVEQPTWKMQPDVLRLIFLVGDAPPKVYKDEMQYPQIAQLAKARGILINPVHCGNDTQTGQDWAQIARLAHGETAHLVDAGQVDRVRTPVDQDLAALNKRLGASLMPYRNADASADAQALAEKMDDAGVSDRLAFKVATGAMIGDDDLLRAIDAGTLSLASVDRSRLPERFRSMSESELQAHLQTVRGERAELTRVIASLVQQRRDWLAQRGAKTGGFDQVVSATIRRQLNPGTSR